MVYGLFLHRLRSGLTAMARRNRGHVAQRSGQGSAAAQSTFGHRYNWQTQAYVCAHPWRTKQCVGRREVRRERPGASGRDDGTATARGELLFEFRKPSVRAVKEQGRLRAEREAFAGRWRCARCRRATSLTGRRDQEKVSKQGQNSNHGLREQRKGTRTSQKRTPGGEESVEAACGREKWCLRERW